MLCRRCEALLERGSSPRGTSTPAPLWGVARIGNLLCAGCGALLGATHVTERLQEKRSQLAQFGLASSGEPLLEPNRPEDD